MPAYQHIFEPVVKVGENIAVFPTNKYGYFKVLYIRQLPEIIHDFGSISAEKTVSDKEVTDLYMNDGEIAQYRMMPLDDIVITVKQPLAKGIWTTRNTQAAISQKTLQLQTITGISEFFVYEDEKIYFNVTNPTKYNISKSRVLFTGFKFAVEKLPTPPEVYTVIPVEGI